MFSYYYYTINCRWKFWLSFYFPILTFCHLHISWQIRQNFKGTLIKPSHQIWRLQFNDYSFKWRSFPFLPHDNLDIDQYLFFIRSNFSFEGLLSSNLSLDSFFALFAFKIKNESTTLFYCKHPIIHQGISFWSVERYKRSW